MRATDSNPVPFRNCNMETSFSSHDDVGDANKAELWTLGTPISSSFQWTSSIILPIPRSIVPRPKCGRESKTAPPTRQTRKCVDLSNRLMRKPTKYMKEQMSSLLYSRSDYPMSLTSTHCIFPQLFLMAEFLKYNKHRHEIMLFLRKLHFYE